MKTPHPVAILCASTKSAYHRMTGVEVYDLNRDALTFPGGMPVVAHPPCRAWSKYCDHQAKPAPGEKELGLWCCEQLRRWGGVLEQPSGSKLFKAACFPGPQEMKGDLWTIEVWQAWWGYPMMKKTWLCFCRVRRAECVVPFRLHHSGGDHRREQLMSHKQRSETVPAFAEWLVNLARLSKP